MALANDYKQTVSGTSIPLSRAEFEVIKARLTQLDDELRRLLNPPLVYATVLTTDTKPLVKNGDVNIVVYYDGKLFEVYASSDMTLKPTDNVKVDLVTKRIHI